MVQNPKVFGGLVKVVVRDSAQTPGTLLFWNNCVRPDVLAIGSTVCVDILSSAVVRASLVKKAAAPSPARTGTVIGSPSPVQAQADSRQYAEYGSLVANFGHSSEFTLCAASAGSVIPCICGYESVLLPSEALAASRKDVEMGTPGGGSTVTVRPLPVLYDIMGIVTACIGKRDKFSKPYCEITMTGATGEPIRVRVNAIGVACAAIVQCRVFAQVLLWGVDSVPAVDAGAGETLACHTFLSECVNTACITVRTVL